MTLPARAVERLCCPALRAAAGGVVDWREPDRLGLPEPDVTGWAILLYDGDDGTWKNIAHCPWCGATLPTLEALEAPCADDAHPGPFVVGRFGLECRRCGVRVNIVGSKGHQIGLTANRKPS